jgi:hypothetical protein
MSYENAPGTKMLSTRCICCGRPLLDALSVEIGIGPVCRKNTGYDQVKVSLEAKQRANGLVHHMAMDQGNFELLSSVYFQLYQLGFRTLADTIGSRLANIKIVEDGNKLYVKAPYNPRFISMSMYLPGRHWSKRKRHTEFRITAKVPLYSVLKRAYPNHIGFGIKGPFKL